MAASIQSALDHSPILTMREIDFGERMTQSVDLHDNLFVLKTRKLELLSGNFKDISLSDDEVQQAIQDIVEATNVQTLSNPLNEYSRLQRMLSAYQMAYIESPSRSPLEQRLGQSICQLCKIADAAFAKLNATVKDNVLTHVSETNFSGLGYRVPNYADGSVSQEEKLAVIDRINLQKLRLESVLEIIEPRDVVAFLKKGGERLTYLNTNHYNGSDDFAQIVACTPNLLELLVYPSWFIQPLDDSILLTVTRLCPRLQKITLYGIPLSSKALLTLAKCRDLSSLIFTECALNDEKVSRLVQTQPNLQELGFSGCDVTDLWLESITAPLTSITKLDLTATNMTEQGLIRLVQLCPQLQTILIGGLNVTDAFVEALVSCCPHISEINVNDTNISDNGVVKIIKAYHGTLTKAQLATKAQTIDVVQTLSLIDRPPKLHQISLKDDVKAPSINWQGVEIDWRKPGTRKATCFQHPSLE